MTIPTSGPDSWLAIQYTSGLPQPPPEMREKFPLSFQPGTENREVHLQERMSYFIYSFSHAPDLHIYWNGENIEPDERNHYRWLVKTDAAGLYELKIEADGYPPSTLYVRAFPKTVNWPTYELMREQLSEFAHDLLFSLHNSGREHVAFEKRTQASVLNDYHALIPIINEFKRIWPQIYSQPYQNLIYKTEHHHLELSASSFANARMLVGPVGTWTNAGQTRTIPLQWEVQRSTMSTDVAENRFLKYFLLLIKHRLRYICTHIETAIEMTQAQIDLASHFFQYDDHWKGTQEKHQKTRKNLEASLINCRKMQKECQIWYQAPFLAQIKATPQYGSPSQVLLRNPLYRKVFELSLRFQKQLRITYDADKFSTMLSLHDTNTLYEYWSMFKITHIVNAILTEQGYEMTSNSTFHKIDERYFEFDVERDKAVIIFQRREKTIQIKYEPNYKHRQNPDYTGDIIYKNSYYDTDEEGKPIYPYFATPDLGIELLINGRTQKVLIFDAKNKINTSRPQRRIYLEKDINKIRSYTTKVWIRQTNRKAASSAYIVYPGDYFEHEDGFTCGAIPLLPDLPEKTLAEVVVVVRKLLRKGGFI